MVFVFIFSSLRLKKRGKGCRANSPARQCAGATIQSIRVIVVSTRGAADAAVIVPVSGFSRREVQDSRPAGGAARVAHAGHYERVMWKLCGNAMEIPRNRDESHHGFASAAADRGRSGRACVINVRASTGTR
ncbi:hypothetical protein [Burkholderia contaminans]|uniref:hypothetical protein n=1 Tax=Burkholderia contaminans TaxID=488447 RepID=UPI00115F9BED|nr:hypothetical protein [Burkholderia contaminans]